jgi:hypothetical protein
MATTLWGKDRKTEGGAEAWRERSDRKVRRGETAVVGPGLHGAEDS